MVPRYVLLTASFIIFYMWRAINGQHIVCSSARECQRQTKNCVNSDCHIDCTGSWSCFQMIIFAHNYSLHVDCTGDGSCRDIIVNAQNAGDLSILCENTPHTHSLACYYSNIFCPSNQKCSIICTGPHTCDTAKFVATNGTKFLIMADGEGSLQNAKIDCPHDVVPGSKYTNDALCKITVSGTNSMKGMQISSTDSWNIDLKCASPPCSDDYSGNKLICGSNLENECFFEPLSSDEWTCSDQNNVCNDLSSSHPTTDPTLAPSFSPTATPTLAPSFSPSKAPTTHPTSAPTENCRAIYVEVNDRFNEFKWRFNGLYIRVTEQHDIPFWEVPQLKNEKYLQYGANDTWRLYGEGNAHYLEVYDDHFLQKLDGIEQNWLWEYSKDAQKYSVTIKCIGSVSPTAAPSFSPTRSPSISPTDNPTMDPTHDPTNEPTFSPTSAPSQPPTASPSRAPTSLSDYNSFMDVSYFIGGMNVEDVTILCEMNGVYGFNETIIDIVDMIESAYVSLDWTLHFYEFYVHIESVNDFTVSYLSNRKRPNIPLTDDCWQKDNACALTLTSKLFCSETNCDYIYDKFQSQSQEDKFETLMTVDFIQNVYPNRSVTENDNIWFAIQSISEPSLINPVPPIEPNWFEQFEYWIVIFVGFMFIVVILIVFYFKHRIKRMRNKKAFIVQNPMVLLVSIGDYEPDIDNVQRHEINAHISDLPGIENDVKHMDKLFRARFGYDVYPKVDENGIRIIWRERDFKEFIEERARYLLNNIDDGKNYDALVLIISSHGIPDYLIMSDYRKYSKLAVQRTFSFAPKLRTIPRLILFDCCSGDQGREDEEIHENEGTATQQKKVDEKDIFDGAENHKYWVGDDQNPDHKLARVNAANAGFTSSLNTMTGSFLIYKMFNKYMDALDGKRTPFPFIHEVFDEIQAELQQEGKQLPESIWNDNTWYLIFKTRDGANIQQRAEEKAGDKSSEDNVDIVYKENVYTNDQIKKGKDTPTGMDGLDLINLYSQQSTQL